MSDTDLTKNTTQKTKKMSDTDLTKNTTQETKKMSDTDLTHKNIIHEVPIWKTNILSKI
jgi:hypothetical protein